MKKLLFPGLIISLFISCSSVKSTNKSNETPKWIQLFNGKDLNDWIIKIAKHELGNNYKNTFRVENGVLKGSAENYENFNQQYGHIYYNKPFSAYLIAVEYRFTGEQAKGGEGWAWSNSGVMLHCQDPKTILRDQDFPISIEAQLLGGDEKHTPRPTANVCTPGTNIVLNGRLHTAHCTESSSKTYKASQWVRSEMLVLADSIVKHIVEGDTVLVYEKPQIGGGNVSNYDPAVKQDGKPLKEGYIALQSESHPVEFRKVELVNLEPYMHDKARLEKVLAWLRANGKKTEK